MEEGTDEKIYVLKVTEKEMRSWEDMGGVYEMVELYGLEIQKLNRRNFYLIFARDYENHGNQYPIWSGLGDKHIIAEVCQKI
jgi:hypothetical protein